MTNKQRLELKLKKLKKERDQAIKDLDDYVGLAEYLEVSFIPDINDEIQALEDSISNPITNTRWKNDK